MKKINSTALLTFVFSLLFSAVYSQQLEEIKLNPEKVKKYQPYIEFKHGGQQGFPSWKENNKMLYAKEMWYYSESFYIKRDHFPDGYTLNEEIIDISRYEKYRKQNEEAIVKLPGFKDALVLLPSGKLIYKP